jgi:hypothetical protein
MIEIRPLQAGETATLVELFDAVLPGFSERISNASSGPAAFLDDPASFAFGAYVDGVPVGLA